MNNFNDLSLDNKKKSNYLKILLLFGGIVCLFASFWLGGQFYSKKNNNVGDDDTNKINNNVGDDDTNKTNNSNKTNEIILLNLSSLEDAITLEIASGNAYDKNMLDNRQFRFTYINYLLMDEEECDWVSSNGVKQKAPRVLYNDYKEKYYNIYGEHYNFETDSKEPIPTIFGEWYDSETQLETEHYVGWNGTINVAAGVKLTPDKETISNDVRIITGKYVYTAYGENDEKGNFEIKYTINDNKEALSSIILIQNKDK